MLCRSTVNCGEFIPRDSVGLREGHRGNCLFDATVGKKATVRSELKHRRMPAVKAPSEPRLCVVCASETRRRCGGCRVVRLCGPGCQRIHWRARHRLMCPRKHGGCAWACVGMVPSSRALQQFYIGFSLKSGDSRHVRYIIMLGSWDDPRSLTGHNYNNTYVNRSLSTYFYWLYHHYRRRYRAHVISQLYEIF